MGAKTHIDKMPFLCFAWSKRSCEARSFSSSVRVPESFLTPCWNKARDSLGRSFSLKDLRAVFCTQKQVILVLRKRSLRPNQVYQQVSCCPLCVARCVPFGPPAPSALLGFPSWHAFGVRLRHNPITTKQEMLPSLLLSGDRFQIQKGRENMKSQRLHVR
uniref:Uncharacterized protein n=1 Tax=Marophrys sp. SRT127 TaxID=2488311 RepID=A0A455RGE1_9EUKA|nr:hypothetical protein [Marophrys sp. SRT127]